MNWETTANFEQAPIGAHAGILISIVDLGTQIGEWKGEETKRRQNLFTWELPFELREDGQPFTVGKFYTQSVGEKANLTKDLTSWLGKAPAAPRSKEEAQDFSEKVIKPLLGKACQVVITEKEDTGKRRVSAVVSLPKGMDVPTKPHNPVVFFDLDNYDETVFDNLTAGVQKMIMKSPEYAKIVGGFDGNGDDVDIPF